MTKDFSPDPRQQSHIADRLQALEEAAILNGDEYALLPHGDKLIVIHYRERKPEFQYWHAPADDTHHQEISRATASGLMAEKLAAPND